MPVNVSLGYSKLKLVLSNGVDDNGKELKKTKTYANIKPTTTDEDVYAIADALISLQKNAVLQVGRLDEKEITQA
ncbi:DUF1659 domain-containing protein [Clostridiaceae bacterium 35-E11]